MGILGKYPSEKITFAEKLEIRVPQRLFAGTHRVDQSRPFTSIV
jgi:hypothetical protein